MKIAHFKTRDSSFERKDQEILERHFQVHNHRIRTETPAVYVLALFRLLFFMLRAGWRYDAYYIRFADWHTAILAFFKRLYRKKLFVVIGGFDVAAIPGLRYGGHLRKSRSLLIKYTMNHASCLLPNSESMIYYENDFIPGGRVYGGIRHFIPEPKAVIEVVTNGFDAGKYRRLPGTEKKALAITVAVIDRERTYRIKGIDRFIETARRLPDYDFLIVGIGKELLDRMQITLPENLKIREYTAQDELILLYSEARVYCTFSISEGMPNALCEAMLCECIPVGTRVTSIPEIIGDSGFVIDKPEIDLYVKAVDEAFRADPHLGQAARERIVNRYSLEQREQKLLSILFPILRA
jgi:glycosyltransferase involved in cell wall biosynthesis